MSDMLERFKKDFIIPENMEAYHVHGGTVFGRIGLKAVSWRYSTGEVINMSSSFDLQRQKPEPRYYAYDGTVAVMVRDLKQKNCNGNVMSFYKSGPFDAAKMAEAFASMLNSKEKTDVQK